MDEQQLSQQELQESGLLKENENQAHDYSQDADAEQTKDDHQEFINNTAVTHAESATIGEEHQEVQGQTQKIDDEIQETKMEEFTEVVPVEVNGIDHQKTTELVVDEKPQEQRVLSNENTLYFDKLLDSEKVDILKSHQSVECDTKLQSENKESCQLNNQSMDCDVKLESGNKQSTSSQLGNLSVECETMLQSDHKESSQLEQSCQLGNLSVECETILQSDNKESRQLEHSQCMECDMKSQNDNKLSSHLGNQSMECDKKLQSDNKQSNQLGNGKVNEEKQSHHSKPKEPNKNPGQGKQNQEPQTKKQKSGVVNENFERINYLVQTSRALISMGASTSESASLDFDRTLASQTGSLAMAVGRRCLIRLTPSLKRMLCKGCGTALIYGVNARVRHRSKRQKHFVITCLTCNTIKRLVNDPNHMPWCEREESLL